MKKIILFCMALFCCQQIFAQAIIKSSPTGLILDSSFECYNFNSDSEPLNTFFTCGSFGLWSYDSPDSPFLCHTNAYLNNVFPYMDQMESAYFNDSQRVFCSLTRVIEKDTLLIEQNIEQNLTAFITGLNDNRQILSFYVANFGTVEGYRGDFSTKLSVTVGTEVFLVDVPPFDPQGARWFPISIEFRRREQVNSLPIKIAVEIQNSDQKASCIVGIDAFKLEAGRKGGVPSPCPTCSSFELLPDKEYIISAWVKQTAADYSELNNLITYADTFIKLYYSFNGEVISSINAEPQGAIIDGWQRISRKFITPPAQTGAYADTLELVISLINDSDNLAFFDDIRIHPIDGNLKSFVYDQQSQKLLAELDENNYATFYEYDKEGGLVRVKKETEKGIFTIQESRSSTKKTAQ